jgi:chromosome partitioning protein
MILAILNQKGGTGKTTTTVNVGSAIAAKGYKVLLIDRDPQGDLSFAQGINEIQHDTSDVLSHNVFIDDSLVEKEKMHILPANIALAKFEMSQIEMNQPADILKGTLEKTGKNIDLILSDCPSSTYWLTINAPPAAQKAIIPTQLNAVSVPQGLNQTINNRRYESDIL